MNLKMARFEIKRGFGFVRSTQTNVTMWHVVKDGHTIASFTDRDAAYKYLTERYGYDAADNALDNERRKG